MYRIGALQSFQGLCGSQISYGNTELGSSYSSNGKVLLKDTKFCFPLKTQYFISK